MIFKDKQETIKFSDAKKLTVLYIFSPACHWCDRNIENIKMLADVQGDTFRLIGIALSDSRLKDYVSTHKLNFPIYKNLSVDNIKMMGLASTPQTIVISPEGKVLKNWIGAYGERLQPQVESFFGINLPGLTLQEESPESKISPQRCVN